ncbi:hypothetical protein DEU56DRAFT_907749 [Suillus clintonianus]|uniref:uncharacterized protein n=1 Tax=Suillus clintonianus TaxID=1904413 RepID=UPI001B87D0B4|nr:uncharacterized protein DEU56DRAFT_907749 [Suillus clintonianus]KAG2153322.1 hypothetical protein DEU56DRAFT_907749 [Suillus clintonianus]
MDPSDAFLNLGGLLGSLAYYTSVSAHQPAGSHVNFVPTDDPDHPTTIPFENRNGTDGTVWPPYILHAPQPSRPLIHQWSGSTYMDSYSQANNQTMGMSIPRPSAPSPILGMQDGLLENFADVSDNSPSYPPRSHGFGRFEPYRNAYPHTHHDAFLCRWDNEGILCGDELQATPKDILTHLRQDHHIGIGNKDTYRCHWVTAHGRCEEQLRLQSYGRHIIKHAGIRMKCSICDTTMPARNDLATRHRRRHLNCSQADFMIVPARNTEAFSP